jgi:hypothetical protein
MSDGKIEIGPMSSLVRVIQLKVGQVGRGTSS